MHTKECMIVRYAATTSYTQQYKCVETTSVWLPYVTLSSNTASNTLEGFNSDDIGSLERSREYCQSAQWSEWKGDYKRTGPPYWSCRPTVCVCVCVCMCACDCVCDFLLLRLSSFSLRICAFFLFSCYSSYHANCDHLFVYIVPLIFVSHSHCRVNLQHLCTCLCTSTVWTRLMMSMKCQKFRSISRLALMSTGQIGYKSMFIFVFVMRYCVHGLVDAIDVWNVHRTIWRDMM